MSPRREGFLKLLVLALCATCWAQSDNIGCFVPGGCVDGVVSGLTIVPTIGECVDFCTGTSGCRYFSYEPTDDVCLVLDECPEVSTDNCLECISGDSSCPNNICALPGEPQKTCVIMSLFLAPLLASVVKVCANLHFLLWKI